MCRFLIPPTLGCNYRIGNVACQSHSVFPMCCLTRTPGSQQGQSHKIIISRMVYPAYRMLNHYPEEHIVYVWIFLSLLSVYI